MEYAYLIRTVHAVGGARRMVGVVAGFRNCMG